MNIKNISKILSGIVISSMTLGLFSFPIEPNAKELPKNNEVQINDTKTDLDRKIVGYFPEWAYKSEAQGYFDVADLQWDELTHIQYSFAMVDETTHKIKFGDKHAAIEEDFNDNPLVHKGKPVELDPNLPYKGHFNALQVMKKQYPDVKLLISVGGWAGSRGFYTMLDTDAGIDTFTDSCVEFIRKYGFDGVDIDFEYPSSTATSGNPDDADLSEPRRKTINARYNVMMKELRKKLDAASKEDGKDYLLTAAVTASSWVLGGVSDNSYAKELDFLSVMSYDFHGGWNEFVENLANIYPDSADTETINMLMPTLCMDWAYRYYRGVLPPEKILMGIPYYSRGWENVNGGTNGLHGKSKTPASGKYNVWGDDLNGDGILEPAGANPLWHILNLAEKDSHFKKYWDDAGKVPHYWQDQEKVFLSFEDKQSINERVKYIEEKNLGGALIWVMNGDYGENPNYVPGSDNINEGKYTFGNTLTKTLSDGFDKIGPCTQTTTDDKVSSLPQIPVEVELNGNYDHPNYTYTFKITNHSDEKINGGWTLSFDLPKSAIYKSSWGGQAKVTEGKEFDTITITGGSWHGIDPGASVEVQGMIGLCFSGIRNVTFNGSNPIGNNTPTNPDTKPDPDTDPDTKPNPDKTLKTPNISSDETTSNDGNYNVTVKIPAQSNASKYMLYENNVLVKQGNVIEDATNETVVKYTATEKVNGTYIYKVVLSNDASTTSASTSVTVKHEEVTPPTPNKDTYDPNKVYNSGDTVIFNGKTYKAKWWTKGETPGISAAWEEIVEPNEDGSVNYTPGKAYTGGSIVNYNGQKYKAKWWTNTKPGSDSSWEII